VSYVKLVEDVIAVESAHADKRSRVFLLWSVQLCLQKTGQSKCSREPRSCRLPGMIQAANCYYTVFCFLFFW